MSTGKSLLIYVAAALLGTSVGAVTHSVRAPRAEQAVEPTPAKIKIGQTDADATSARCIDELGVSSRDLDDTAGLTRNDLTAVWVSSGNEGLVCVRAVVDGKAMDSSFTAPGTYGVDTLTADKLTLVHADHTYLVIGAVTGLPEAPESGPVYLVAKEAADDPGEANPVALVEGGGFMAMATDPYLGGDGTGLVLTVISDTERTDLKLGNADWAPVG